MLEYRYEYRINGKKNCECFRSEYSQYIIDKFNELSAKHPNINYSLEVRSVRLDKYGVAEGIRTMGREFWNPWESTNGVNNNNCFVRLIG